MFSVLIVDDSIENIDVLKGILKDEYKVSAATGGKMALKIAEKTIPDIILLDIMMSEMDGYKVCIKLKENPLTKMIPIIFVTAKDQEIDEIEGFNVGAVDYLTKPINPTITKARIKTHLALADQKKGLEIEVSKKTKEINETKLEVIRKLGKAAEFRDNETGLHVDRMSRYACLIAREYGLEESQCELILHVAPMHDIGKIGIPDFILQKPGKLTKEEWEIMTSHTTIGGEILGDSCGELLSIAKIVAYQHHEKWNGKGYPNGLAGEDINIFARITAIADVFDALTSKRPYKEEWPVEKAVELIISERGEHFEPKTVDSFLKVLPQLIEVKKRFSE